MKQDHPSKFDKKGQEYLTVVIIALSVIFALILFSGVIWNDIFNYVFTTSFLLTGLVLFVVAFLLYIIIDQIIEHRYVRIISQHSEAIKELIALNNEFTFHEIPNFNIQTHLDNEAYYSTVSPKDYLTYELVYKHSEVAGAMKFTDENRSKHLDYCERGNRINSFDTYSLAKKLVFEKKRIRIERKLFRKLIQRPTTVFEIRVSIVLTNINGYFKNEDAQVFGADEIRQLIRSVRNKSGDYYRDNDVWQSICRVERAKVTNRMRFAIFERDGHRCKKCGSPYDLEIDHIFPISKGGKTTFDNLQTLCRDCNTKKSNTIERGAIDPKTKRFGTESKCPQCGSTLIVRNGKNGRFLGCSSYPACRFTKSIK